MSFYRNLIVAVAAMGLSAVVFAQDTTTTTTTTDTTATTPDTTTTTTPDTTTTVTPDATTSTTATVGDNSTDTTATTTTTTTTTTTDKVDINKATAKQLMKLKGINAARAKAIVTYRKKHGDFKTVDEIREVKGFKKMNEKRLQEIQDQLTAG